MNVVNFGSLNLDHVYAVDHFCRAGETIHTENSHKFDRRSQHTLLLAGGWTPVERWLDGEERFSVLLARATRPRNAP